jgi:2-dehydropantoate 2-reductase
MGTAVASRDMRIVVYGAGAVGGVIGARLAEHGHEVALIARGDHLNAIKRQGLQVESPEGSVTLRLQAFAHPAEVEPQADDIVVLATKSQDTSAALRALAASAPPLLPVVCAQNGVANERTALRRFRFVYGVHVMLPATFLAPGIVQANSAPMAGLLDVGRYPAGADDTAHLLADAFKAATFDSIVVEDIMRWKYRKLLMNLGNAVEAVFEPSPERDEVERLAVREGKACLRTAGIDFASSDEDRARRGDLLHILPVEGRDRAGGSSWQSLARATGSIEADYLNGEIVLLGRLHGVATPVNALLQRLANEMALSRRPPASVAAGQVLSRLTARSHSSAS